MKIPSWLPFFHQGFPIPKRHSLTLEEFLAFWSDKLTEAQRSECAVRVYRMDPALAPFPSMVKIEGHMDRNELDAAIQPMMPDAAWREKHPEIKAIVFCARLQRVWRTEVGTKSTEEVCICTFEVSAAAGVGTDR